MSLHHNNPLIVDNSTKPSAKKFKLVKHIKFGQGLACGKVVVLRIVKLMESV